MTIKEFLKNLYSELEIESVADISLETNLKDLDEWDSMAVLVLIGFLDENFSITTSGEDVNKFNTVEDIINFIGLND